MRLSSIAVAAAVASLAAAPAASAYKLAPPGNSAVSQYVENVPGAKGNVPTTTIRSHSGSGGSVSLAPSTQHALASQGTDGARAAALANATAPAGVHGENRRHRSGGASGAGGASGGSGTGGGASASTGSAPVSGAVGTPTSAVLKAVTGSATHGLGPLLPVILVLGAIGAGMLSLLRRRRAA